MSIEQEPSAAIFGLTGGMGSGKSTVSSQLAEMGAELFDADAIVKGLQKPGEPGHIAMVEILGEDIVGENGEIDRKQAASLMFTDPELLKSVNNAIHPMVWEAMWSGARELNKGEIAIFDVPLLKPEHTINMLGVVVVNTSLENAIHRLAGRGYSPEQAEERIKTQMSNEERAEMADFVIDNDGNLAELELQVSEAWEWMLDQAQTQQR